MSSRNSKAGKVAARERLRAERERQAKRNRVRRQLMVGGGVVALLAVAAGGAVAVSALHKDSYWTAAAKHALVKPAHTEGADGTTVVVGNADSKNTLDAYEDMRCPICAAYEQKAGSAVLDGAKAGKYKISYTFGTFLDGKEGGNGSKKALSALGASLNVSVDAFEQYHALLYSAGVHPQETDDAFDSAGHLIALAQKVPALKGNATFSDAVTKGTYDRWALAMSAKFDHAAGVQGTPTVKLNGKDINVIDADSATVMSSIQAGLKK